jgi:hypothetical protein
MVAFPMRGPGPFLARFAVMRKEAGKSRLPLGFDPPLDASNTASALVNI